MAPCGIAVICHPDRVQALIVAVDHYTDDRIPKLKSPVRDALDVLRWLGKLGVPPEHTTFHVATKSPYQAPLDEDVPDLGTRLDQEGLALGIRFATGPEPEAGAVRLMDAKRDAVGRSVGRLLRLPAGGDGAANDLIVFLLGHGFLIPMGDEPTTRIFLTEDYSEDYTTNIDVAALADLLCYTMAFRHVTVVFDACSTQPFGDDERETVVPVAFPELRAKARSLNTATGVALCSASGQLERAQESLVEGDGSVFLSAFLEATEPDRIEDEYVEFEDDNAVVDLRRVMARHVIPRVRDATNQDQTPELSAFGAYNRSGDSTELSTVMPLYLLDRDIDKTAFRDERSAREAAGIGRNPVDTALRRRNLVGRIRGLRLEADRFREAASLAATVPKDGTGWRPLFEGLLAIESDLRSQVGSLRAEALDVPPEMSDELREGRRVLTLAMELADRAREPSGDDRMARLVSASKAYQTGLQWLRLVMEVAYTRAVWEALRNVVRRTEGLDADRAVRILGQWVAIADAPLLTSKADAIASRVGTDDGSLGLLLLRQHLRLEHERSSIRGRLDQYTTPTAVDSLEQVRAQVADVLVGDAATPLLEAIRRLLDSYPAASDALDHTVLEALGRRAAIWTWRAAG